MNIGFIQTNKKTIEKIFLIEKNRAGKTTKINRPLSLNGEKAELLRENGRHEIELLEYKGKSFDLAKNKLVLVFTDYDPEDYFKTCRDCLLII